MEEIVQKLRLSFNTHATKSVEWRVKQLKAFERMLVENEAEICAAVKQDLNKPEQETVLTEVGIVKNAIRFALDNLNEYANPKQVTPQLQMRLSYSTYVQHQPYGVVLVIGAWNYPFQLCLVPLVGAIASGNCVLVKPSELSEQSALTMEKLLTKYLDQNCIKVVNGGVPETIELLKCRFDYIMYTGNTMIGKSIMEAASKYMTPVTLECGGKSPAYIDANADLKTSAKRLIWGKFTNAGQTCVAPDYVLCSKETQENLLPVIKEVLKECYGENAQESKSYSRIVNARHFNRVKALIDESKVVHGGKTNEAEKYIEPTIMFNCTDDDKVMKDEIFGPVLPFVTVKDDDEAIEYINKHEKPLALYVFSSNDKVYNNFLKKTSSGCFSFNEVLIHCGLECLPFGGVGNSGMGAYHGKYSFDTFSHQRAVLKGSFFGDSLMGFRYPPYNESKLKQARIATSASLLTDMCNIL